MVRTIYISIIFLFSLSASAQVYQGMYSTLDQDIEYNGTVSTAIDDAITLYGIAPCYSTGSNAIIASSSTSGDSLHQFIITKVGSRYFYVQDQKEITGTFAYTVGNTYYLQDDGSINNTSDGNGSTNDFDSAVLIVLESLGSNKYIVNILSPKHFLK